MGTCLLRLVLLPLIIAFIYPWLLMREPWPTLVYPAEGAEAAAVVSGLFLWFAVICWLDLRRLMADRERINQSILREGEKIAVSGPITSTAPLLTAPLSGQPCVGYYYAVTHSNRGSGRSGPTHTRDYEGYALVPAVIASPLGNLNVLAPSKEEVFYEVPATSPDGALERAQGYLSTTDFSETRSEQGSFRVDKKNGDPKDLAKCDFQEKIIRNNETVLAVGVYSETKVGIAPDPDDIMRPFHIVPNGEAVLDRKARNRRANMAVFAILAATVVAFYLVVYVPRSA